MSCFRSSTKNSIHTHLSRTTSSYKESSTYGKYGITHGVYHLAVIGDGDKMWKLSRREDWYYQQFKITMDISMVFYNHQLTLAHFVSQHGKGRTDDARLCSLILQSEKLQNSSQDWLKMALVEYRAGQISVEDMFQVMTYLPMQRWFECVEILISIEIDLQIEEQNGRLAQVRTILQVLSQHSEQCETYVPLQRIGWYAKRICTLWSSISIRGLLKPEQVASLSANYDYLRWLKDSNQVSEQQYIHFYLQSASISDGVVWILDQSVERVRAILEEVRLEVLSYVNESDSEEDHLNMSMLIQRWIFLSATMYRLEKNGILISDSIWEGWLKGIQSCKPSKVSSDISKLHRQPDETRAQKIRTKELWKHKRKIRNGLRIFSETPSGLLKWIAKYIQSVDQSESIDHAVPQQIRRVLQNREKVSLSPLLELDDSEDFDMTFSAWVDHVKIHGIEEKEFSNSIVILQKKSFSVQQQDQVLDIFLPLIEKERQPQQEVFCYLYLSQGNHSPEQQVRLAKYFDRYFDISKFTANNESDLPSLVKVLMALVKYLAKDERWAQSKKVDAYICEIIDHESLELFRTSLVTSMILIPLKWGAWETACRRIEQSSVPYGKLDMMSKQIQNNSEEIVTHMIQNESVWCHLTHVLQWRFFFEHSMVSKMAQLTSLSTMLSRAANESVLHMFSNLSEYLLEVLLSISLTERFPVCSSSVKPILQMVLKHKLPIFKESPYTPTIEKQVVQLVQEAHQVNDDLMRAVLIYSMVRLARFFDVSLEPNVVLPEESKTKKGSSTDPAVVRHYTEAELTEVNIDTLYQRSKSDFIPFMHFKRMIDVVEDERQPLTLRVKIRKYVCEDAIQWSHSLRNKGMSEDIKGFLKIYEMLVQWMERETIVSTLEEVTKNWDEWCILLPYSVVLESYIEYNSLQSSVRFIPEKNRFNARTQFLCNGEFISEILAVHKGVSKHGRLSSVDVYFFMLNQYQADEEVFQRCLDWLLNHSKQMIDRVWTHRRVVVLSRKTEVFLAVKNHLVDQKRYTELVCFISKFPEPDTELISLIRQELLGSTNEIISVYEELVSTGVIKISTFNIVFELVYGKSIELKFTSKIQRMLIDGHLRIETAERIVRRVLVEDSSILSESKDLIAMDLIDRTEVFDKLFKKCIQQSNPVAHLQQHISSGLFDLQMVSNAFKQNMDSISVKAIRKFALVEPAKQTLHRDLVLSILIAYAKNDDSTMVTQITEMCPDLIYASK